MGQAAASSGVEERDGEQAGDIQPNKRGYQHLQNSDSRVGGEGRSGDNSKVCETRSSSSERRRALTTFFQSSNRDTK